MTRTAQMNHHDVAIDPSQLDVATVPADRGTDLFDRSEDAILERPGGPGRLGHASPLLVAVMVGLPRPASARLGSREVRRSACGSVVSPENPAAFFDISSNFRRPASVSRVG